MNTTGEPISAEEAFEYGLVNRRRARPRAVRHRAGLGAQVRAARRRSRSSRSSASSHQGDLDEGIAAEKEAFATVFASEDAREGIGAFLQKRNAGVQGQVSAGHDRLAELIRSAGSVVALTGAGDLGAVRDPRLPLARDRAVGERRPDGGRPHLRLAARPGALLGLLRRSASRRSRARSPTAPTARWSSSSTRPARRRDHAEHRRPARARRASRDADRGPRLDRHRPRAWWRRARTRSTRRARGWRRRPTACRAATAASR